jgi:hypothetical protein
MKQKPPVKVAMIASMIAVLVSTTLLLPRSEAEPSTPDTEASIPKPVVPAADWLMVTPHEKLACVSAHLRGLDMSMVETTLMITMCVAMVSNKIPILLGQEFLGFSLRPLSRYGLQNMMHESRSDICMLLGSAYLQVVCAGRLSLDARISERRP